MHAIRTLLCSLPLKVYLIDMHILLMLHAGYTFVCRVKYPGCVLICICVSRKIIESFFKGCPNHRTLRKRALFWLYIIMKKGHPLFLFHYAGGRAWIMQKSAPDGLGFSPHVLQGQGLLLLLLFLSLFFFRYRMGGNYMCNPCVPRISLK